MEIGTLKRLLETFFPWYDSKLEERVVPLSECKFGSEPMSLLSESMLTDSHRGSKQNENHGWS